MNTPFDSADGSLFSPGELFMTSNVRHNIPPEEILTALQRHLRGDWGNLEREDISSNEQALKSGGRLVSSYRSINGVKFYIITEADRSTTTALLPEDY